MAKGGKGRRNLLLPLLIIALLSIPAAGLKTATTDASNQAPNNLVSSLDQLTSYVTTKDDAKDPLIYAKSNLLLDANTATVLKSQDETERVPIASTTKMVTALVARKVFKLDDIITVPAKAVAIGGSEAGLIANGRYTVQSLLSALLIPSGNDAAYTFAYTYSNDPANFQPFVDLMNKYVADNNLTDTHYADPAGLDDAGYSTAFDLANIARLVMQDPVLAKIVDTSNANVSTVDGTNTLMLKNTNHLVVADDPLYNANVIGVKTGFTPAAGHCLVAAATINDQLIIGVVLNTNEFTITASAKEMRKLLIWANENMVLGKY